MRQFILFIATVFLTFIANSQQTKNFIDQPYLEVSGSADTLVTPNEIYISIILSEKDNRDRVSLEDMEKRMVEALKELGIDTEKDLALGDILSNFKTYFLKSRNIIKTKSYTLKVSDANIAGLVFMRLEEAGISNVSIDRISHTDRESIQLQMNARAAFNAKSVAVAITGPLGQSPGPAIHITRLDAIVQALPGSAAGIRIRGLSTNKGTGMIELPKIEFEKIRISATVHVKFALQ